MAADSTGVVTCTDVTIVTCTYVITAERNEERSF